MKLAIADCPVWLLLEGYGRTQKMAYGAWKHDPRPHVLVLGKWRNPRTRNELVGGINLNYLSDAEIEELQKKLQQVIGPDRNLKRRYWRGRNILPGVFNKAYRTYRKDRIVSATPATLRFIKTAEKEAEAAKGQEEPEEQEESEPVTL